MHIDMMKYGYMEPQNLGLVPMVVEQSGRDVFDLSLPG